MTHHHHVSRAVGSITPGARRAFAVSTGIAVFFVFLQSITAGNFIEDGLAPDAREIWTNLHGALAYPIMVGALIAAAIALTRLRSVAPLDVIALGLFVATVAQWLTGHAISGLGMDWVTPVHVALAFIVYGLAIWQSIRAAQLRRTAPR